MTKLKEGLTKEYIEHAARFYVEANGHVPSNVEVRGDSSLSYNWVEGEMCTDVAKVWKTAKEALWDGPSVDMPGSLLSSYSDRIGLAVRDLQRSGRLSSPDALLVTELTMSLFWLQRAGCLATARLVHGDLTLENTVERATDGEATFIDPSPPRLWCREVDEAKLMQSVVLRWESLVTAPGIRYALRDMPFHPKLVHWIILAGHVVRIMTHRNDVKTDVWSLGALNRIRKEVQR